MITPPSTTSTAAKTRRGPTASLRRRTSADEDHGPERLRRDERRDDGHLAAVVGLEGEDVRDAEEHARGKEVEESRPGERLGQSAAPDKSRVAGHHERPRDERRRGCLLRAEGRLRGVPADDHVARGEEDRRRAREGDPQHPEVGRPRRLADKEEPRADDQGRAECERPLEGLVEEQDRQGRRDERRGSHDHRCPRGAGVPDGEDEHDLREPGGEEAREREDGELLRVGELARPGLHEHREEGDHHGDERAGDRADVRLGVGAKGHAERNRHRPEEHGGREREEDGGHRRRTLAAPGPSEARRSTPEG